MVGVRPSAVTNGAAIARETPWCRPIPEIYDNISSRTPQRLEVITTLVGEDGVAAFSSRESPGGTPGADVRNARIPVTRQIPLKEMRPGRYVLRLEPARSAAPPNRWQERRRS